MNMSGVGRDDILRKCPQYDQLHDFVSDRPSIHLAVVVDSSAEVCKHMQVDKFV